MKISPFQALTLLAKKYRDSKPESMEGKKFTQIHNLFLMGVQSKDDREHLNELLKDEALDGYEVALGDKDVINNDPVRRYYESTLAHETLKTTIDALDAEILKKHSYQVYKNMPLHMRFLVPLTIYNGDINGQAAKKSATAPEYITAIQKLGNPKNFFSLKPLSEEMNGAPEKELQNKLEERINKMMMLVKTVHAAMTAVNTGGNENFPLNLYGDKNGPYAPQNRGRTDKKDEEGTSQTVHSTNLGIMWSYHPLSRDDPLYEEPNAPTSGQYRRPADNSTYISGAKLPEKFFATEVSPFVNSISGTMLCQLRVMAKLLEENKLVFLDNPEQLKAFFKSLVSYMIYNSGGHSFQEFMSVLDLPEVQDVFSKVPGFEDINLRTLFQEQNQSAFQASMDAVISYNDKILAKKQLHEELIADEKNHSENSTGVIEDDELTRLARSRLQLTIRGESSLLRKNRIIDREYQIYTSFESSLEDKEKAAAVLVGKLDIKLTNPNNKKQELEFKINLAMAQRQEELRERLFSSETTLAKSLDNAWSIYQNIDRTIEDRLIAQSFLMYALNIKPTDINVNLNKTIQKLMLERESVKNINPEYIPGKSPIDLPHHTKVKIQKATELNADNEINQALASRDLLDVNPLSKRKDKGLITGRKTEFYATEEREMLRVLIHRGQFVKEDKSVDTRDSISHGKKGFAAFTINVNGEISIFQHIDHDKTGIAHSSMNKGAPVVGAGEIRIEKGKLISITDHSGHYRPSLYNMYKVLEYFKKQGVSIDETQVLTLANPSKLEIIFSKSKEFSRFHVINAEDLCNGYKAHLKAALESARKDLERYQTPNFKTALYFIKDFIMDKTETSDRIKVAKELSARLTNMSQELNNLHTVEEIKEFSGRLKDACGFQKNTQENMPTIENYSSGRLGKKMQTFRDKLKEITKNDKSSEEYAESLKGIHRT